ncbi:MAG: phosphopantetheine-binding protein [Methylomonas sp.]|nr:phosphopantetheine-binding protein [Methylomonas sp.]
MSLQNQLVEILTQVLQLNPKNSAQMNDETPLLGAIPEFDSMAVVTIITALEDRFGFAVDDDEIDASIFETVGSLVTFVEGKLQAG